MKQFQIYASIALTAGLLLIQGCGGGGGYGGGGGGSSGSGLIASITITPATSSVAVNGMQQYAATAKDSNGNTVNGATYSWTSSSNSVATINGNGLATGVAAGTAMITASITYSGGVYGMGTTITSNSATLTVTAAGMVMGTAAVGHAFSDVLVSLKDSMGQMQVATTDAQGRFQLAVSGMHAPYILKVADNQGHVMFSLGNAAGVINIDPLTDAIARLWYQAHGSSVEAAFTNPNGQSVPDDASLKTLDGALVQLLANALTAQGLDPAALSLLHTPFTADSTGLDGLLDHISVNMNGGNLVLDNSLAGGQEITMGASGLTVTLHDTGAMNTGMTDLNMTGMGTMASARMTELTIHLTH